jgi:hypothetical protein
LRSHCQIPPHARARFSERTVSYWSALPSSSGIAH